MRKTIAFVLTFWGLSYSVLAQTAPLALPFFDDFAKSDQLDASKWELKGGVFINNSFSKAPLTRNIATFSSVSATGKLSANTTVVSYTSLDTLTSKPINLSAVSGADSVYLSFYLQAGGGISKGGFPDFRSFFLVEFKNNGGTWQEALRINATTTNLQDFRPLFVAITDPVFFHSGFQFRFRHIGRNNFDRDNWNLDYVFLNKNRSKLQIATFDIATSRPLTPLLKHYTAMPIHQFQANIAGELSDSVYTTLNNLGDSARAVALYSKTVMPASGPLRFSSKAVLPFVRQVLPDTLYKPAASLFSNLSGFQDIKHTIYLITNEGSAQTRYNDTISRVSALHDYFAYDDGSAEDRVNAFIITTGSGQTAVKYHANQNDMVKALMVYLPRVQNTKNTNAVFRIWNSDSNGNPANPSLVSKSFTVPDLELLDNWFQIPVNPPVSVNGDFFVGWSVNTATPLFSIGIDRNQTGRGNIRTFNGGTSWSKVNADYAIMLRPVMNNNITGISEEQRALTNIKLFPNPATDLVTIRGAFEKGILLDATGRQVRQFAGTADQTQVEVQNLPAGLYLLKLQNKTAAQTFKLIIKPNQ